MGQTDGHAFDADDTAAVGEELNVNDVGVGRLEAFSDGVLAVIITVTALNLRAPLNGTFAAMEHRLPSLLVYAANFLFLGIYWNNHHHLLRAATRLSTGIMWSNLALLFFLSLIPVLTQWVAADYHDRAPAVTYGVVALASALSFTALTRSIIRAEARPVVARLVGRDRKSLTSLVLYALGTASAFASPWPAYALYVGVSLMWFVPDRRFARAT